MTIYVKDLRPAAADFTIAAENAQPGQLYQTVGGQVDNIVQAVKLPASAYRKHVRYDGLAFVYDNGYVYPYVTDRLLPIIGRVVWVANGDPTRKSTEEEL